MDRESQQSKKNCEMKLEMKIFWIIWGAIEATSSSVMCDNSVKWKYLCKRFPKGFRN